MKSRENTSSVVKSYLLDTEITSFLEFLISVKFKAVITNFNGFSSIETELA
jgi:hypothetical protein